MMRIGVVAAAVSLAACGNSGPSAAGQGRTAPAAAGKLDVAGVRPGMSAADVKATLEHAGWRTESFPGKNWAAEVEYEAGRQRGRMVLDQPRRGIETIQARKGDEQMIVSMRATPAGSVVKLVKYEAPLAGRTLDQIRSEMPKRYGPANVSLPGPSVDMTWCMGGERCRSSYGTANGALHVSTDVYNKLRIVMSEGVTADRAWQAKLAAAAGSGAPAKSSF